MEKALELRHIAHKDMARVVRSDPRMALSPLSLREICKLAKLNHIEMKKKIIDNADIEGAIEIAHDMTADDPLTNFKENKKQMIEANIGSSYEEFFNHELRSILNRKKWELIEKCPDDPVAIQMKEQSEGWKERKKAMWESKMEEEDEEDFE
jgi:hypothetical protein